MSDRPVSASNAESLFQLYRDKSPEKPGIESKRKTVDLNGRDRYGFKISASFVDQEKYNTWWDQYSRYLIRRKLKWVKLMNKNGFEADEDSMPTKFPTRSEELKRYVRKGIPAEWRGNAWFYFCKGPERLSKNKGLYDNLCAKMDTLDEVNLEAIEKDLHRTFPDNIHFNDYSGEESLMIGSLRRVLRCYALYNPEIGYCQSLNFIAGQLLIFMDEEKTFWMLVIIHEKLLVDVHTMNLEGVSVHQGVLLLCFRQYLPLTWSVMREHDTINDDFLVNIPSLGICTTSWFMSLFIGILPVETVLRIWDCLFYEDSKSIFRISLGIFKLMEPQFVKTPEDELYHLIQSFPRTILNPNDLLDVCYRKLNSISHLKQQEIQLCKQYVINYRAKYKNLKHEDNNLLSNQERLKLLQEGIQEFGKPRVLKGLRWNSRLNKQIRKLRVESEHDI
ncbi:Rab GTPase-activating protein [Komagataella phaffii CBS 7435]|uniref:GTPase-activating protein for Sec4p and several other Rab GTPases, regulates exocytosis via its acti n=2 Tax=Komagataella phaffii TaxID=460519 RepID=C4QZK1_KOMPG|nr:uncharacterized protein PAS_chr2-1_0074 [Komagataella phaffii GS115]AOA62007.1 GQ67_00097T0 [Komagataella phaffii]CAH2448830.1 Rab GTPase-activating protein [Komagataella phaffii CBS 7435]AOA67469.1 GQ68_01290T0 [Komagataella phaffii GS115]CAY68675.1 GTPase-activating protein for Sec4p and several other Rab GTPases, regulates exocytosis via its acti [Komagataella phaffii GS115]SCV12123.1 Rab GTPase-activating protein [Komagataella phaffii CBS 7435]